MNPAAGFMIAKPFFLAKVIHRILIQSFRDKKSLLENLVDYRAFFALRQLDEPFRIILITLPAKSTLAEVDMLAREEFPRKLIIVTVRNVGRLPITVQGWTVQLAKKYHSSQLAFAIGPELPFRIDVGESTTWGVEIERIASIFEMLHDNKNSKRIKIQAEVELGDSRTILTRQKIWL